MRLRISDRGGETPPSLKLYVEQQVQRLSRIYEGILEAEATLTHEKHRQTLDLRVHVNGKTHKAAGVGDNLRVATDDAVSKLRRQLERHKAKQRRHSLTAQELALSGKLVDDADDSLPLPELPATGDVPRRRRARGSPPKGA